MRLCALARVSAAVVACLFFAAGQVSAQEAPAQTTASPAGGETLPEIEVKTPAATKPAPKPKAKKPAAGTGDAPAATAGTSGTADGSDPAKPETATGPVKGYSAKQSATGTKTDTPLKEIPQSISVVGAEQIRDMGAQSVQDALRYVPGTVADAYGFDSRTDSVLIRGTEAAEYLDGLRR